VQTANSSVEITAENAPSLSHQTVPKEPLFSLSDLSLWARLLIFYDISRSVFQSFLGHLRTHSTKEYRPVDFGLALQRQADGSYQPVARTVARSASTDRLLAKYPWADSVDVRIFLEGFDEGECWHSRSADSKTHSHSALT
jgi:hypothetical protein